MAISRATLKALIEEVRAANQQSWLLHEANCFDHKTHKTFDSDVVTENEDDLEESQFEDPVIEPEGHWSMTSDDPQNPVRSPGMYKSHTAGIKAAEKFLKVTMADVQVPPPSKKSLDPTKVARPSAKKKAKPCAEGSAGAAFGNASKRTKATDEDNDPEEERSGAGAVAGKNFPGGVA